MTIHDLARVIIAAIAIENDNAPHFLIWRDGNQWHSETLWHYDTGNVWRSEEDKAQDAEYDRARYEEVLKIDPCAMIIMFQKDTLQRIKNQIVRRREIRRLELDGIDYCPHCLETECFNKDDNGAFCSVCGYEEVLETA